MKQHQCVLLGYPGESMAIECTATRRRCCCCKRMNILLLTCFVLINAQPIASEATRTHLRGSISAPRKENTAVVLVFGRGSMKRKEERERERMRVSVFCFDQWSSCACSAVSVRLFIRRCEELGVAGSAWIWKTGHDCRPINFSSFNSDVWNEYEKVDNNRCPKFANFP